MPLGNKNLFFIYIIAIRIVYVIMYHHVRICSNLETSVISLHCLDIIRWLTFQLCPLRGHEESLDSINRGNFLEMLKLLASYNKDVDAVVLENALGNAKYTSPEVQVELLGIYARKVQNTIREEIGNNKFCIMVDEARDESKKEQMAIVLRFVNKEDHIKESFLDLIHVSDTTALTLKNTICAQGYDDASNMRGGGMD